MISHPIINICSTKFSVLRNKNFQNARAGQKLSKKLLIVIIFVVSASLLSIINLLSSGLLDAIDDATKVDYSFGLLPIILFFLYVIALVLLVAYGFEATLATCIVALMGIGLIIYVCFETQLEKPGMGGVLLFLGLSIALAWIGAAITAFFVTLSSMYFGVIGEFLAILGYGLIADVLIIEALSLANPRAGDGVITLGAVIALILTGAIIARQAVRGSPKFAWIREKAVFWAATGGTSFYGVDLTDACFDSASLPHTDFRKAILTRASFEGATGLDLARLQGTILEQPKVRKLIINKIGCDEDYTGANFNGASLRGADLTGANLTEVQALDADFTGAILTDACIQGWNINKNTCFKDVICKRIYLKGVKKGDRLILSEPKPDSGEFKPGEFEKWIGELQKTVDLIFREGLNWRAFMFSLAQTAIEHEGLDLSRYDIARKDENTTFAKIGLFPGADNAAIHEAFQRNYEYAEKVIESKYQLVLQANAGELERLKTFAESNQQIIRELMSIVVGTGRQILIQGESHKVYLLNQSGGEVEIMEGKKETKVSGDLIGGDKGDKITIGGDNMTLTGSSITLGDLNGQVNNTIQQLKDVNADGSDNLAKILTTLQIAIQGDAALSESQKKEALEAVETIAEEGKKPPEERTIKYCSMAVNALKGVAGAVSDASKLAEVLKTCLPTLTGLLGI